MTGVFDPTTPSIARVYDYFLGGKDNFAADRETAEQAADRAEHPSGGPGFASDARIVYVDKYPIVHTHANALLAGDGNATAVLADLRDPETILTNPGLRELIDFTEPVAVLLIAILHFFPDADDPGRILATLRDELPRGSYLAVSHGTADFHDQASVSRASAVYAKAAAPVVLRSHQQVSGFFEGFDLIEPGVVQVPLWRPDHEPLPPGELAKVAIYGGVGHVR